MCHVLESGLTGAPVAAGHLLGLFCGEQAFHTQVLVAEEDQIIFLLGASLGSGNGGRQIQRSAGGISFCDGTPQDGEILVQHGQLSQGTAHHTGHIVFVYFVNFRGFYGNVGSTGTQRAVDVQEPTANHVLSGFADDDVIDLLPQRCRDGSAFSCQIIHMHGLLSYLTRLPTVGPSAGAMPSD